MTTTDSTSHGSSAFRRLGRSRWVPIAAATTAAALTAAAIATAGGGTAGAAAALPQAQSVGNFLDATLGGDPIDDVVALDYASAKSPGTQSVQNPLDATLLNAINLPLTGALQLPNFAGITLGAVNQVAVAHPDGSSYGASGAVSNSGGVSVGGDNNAFPANASVDLCASALTGGECGSSSGDALGELSLNIGAVAAVASTPKGYGKDGDTTYQIAGLDLDLSSPLLGSVLVPLTGALTDILNQLSTALGNALPAGCTLTPDLNFDDGVLTLNATNGSIGISVGALLEAVGLNLNSLPPNTDLIDEIITYLTSPEGLAAGVQAILDGLVGPLETALTNCNPGGLVGQLLDTVLGIISTGKDTIETVVGAITDALGGADFSALLGPLTDLLKTLIDIGVNVQPNGPAGTYTSPLDATPKQGTPVVADQTIVRAIEIDLLSGGTPALPVPGNASARKLTAGGVHALAAPANDALAVVALANAAAGPSTAPAAPPTTAPPTATSTSVPPTTVPTGVPAGQGTREGNPALPIVLLGLGLIFAGGGVLSYRMRGTLNKH